MPVTLTQLSVMILLATFPLLLMPELPENGWLAITTLVCMAMLLLRWRPATLLAITLLLFCWATFNGNGILARLVTLTGSNIHARVTISEVVREKGRVRIRLSQADNQLLWPPVYAWLYGMGDRVDDFCEGQRWHMSLRLRPVHSRLNEGGFDRQRYALANAQPFQGRMLAGTAQDNRCSLRWQIMQKARGYTDSLAWKGVLKALAFGDRSDMSVDVTQRLRETGTAHLMAISGLHIGLAAGVGWLAARAGQLLMPAVWIGYRLPMIAGLLTAMGYCWLSGGNPPALRAMLALTLWSGLRICGWHCRAEQVWLFCLALLLLSDPLSVLSDSLALSAGAVGGLLLWYRLAPLPERFQQFRWCWLRLLHLQLGMLLLMLPLQAMVFHGFSLSSLLANLWAVPLVSFITVPLVLVAVITTFSETVAGVFWWLADLSLSAVFWPLSRIPAGWFTLSHDQCWFALLLWLALFAWRFGFGLTCIWPLLALTVSLWTWRYGAPRPEWRVDMLDVGHGLAVVISQQHDAVIYDTGGRWEEGDAGKAIIAPWLKWHNLQLREIILSHGHLDHTGGSRSLQAIWPRALVRSALKQLGHRPCYAGIAWRWRRLSFTVLWPPKREAGEGNNDSCVIKVSDGQRQLLLTGDLEAAAEYRLLRGGVNRLQATVLQVGHHGSRTSSSPPFIRAVKGEIALASAARYSPWRLPSPQIRKRFVSHGYQWHDTATSGQLSVLFYHDNLQIHGLREQIMPRWYHHWFGVREDSR